MAAVGQQIMLEWAGVHEALNTGGRDSSKADNSDGNPELLLLTQEGHPVMLLGLRQDILKFFMSGIYFSILFFSKHIV